MLEPTNPRPLSAPTPARTAGVCALCVALLLALIGLVVAFGQPSWRQSSVWLPLLFGACSAAPFVIIGVVLYRQTIPWAVGAVSTLAWITILTSFAVTIGGFLMGILILVGFPLPGLFAVASVAERLHSVMPGGAYFLLAIAFAICIAIIVNAREARRTLPPGQRGLGTGQLLALGYGAVAVPWFVNTAQTRQQQAFETSVQQQKNHEAFAVTALRSIRRIQSCLFNYERAHVAEGFPAHLDSIGPGGTSCVDSATVRPLASNARIGYLAPADSSGHRGSFWLLAAPGSKSSALAYTYYADEKGVVYDARLQTQYHPDGTYGTPPAPIPPADRSAYYTFEPVGSPTSELGRIRRCFEQTYQERKRLYPPRLQHSTCWQYNWVASGDTLSFLVAASSNYKFVYHPRRVVNDSSFSGFDIDMRPGTYGVDGIRSYWMDESGEIHWTRDDRPARRTDPLLGNCPSWQSCFD